MIPILYEKNETDFTGNGLGRLRDCVSCTVTEERNGLYECDFEYPTTGVNYEQITLGRIIGVTHDDTDDVQPFDIISYSRPINNVVKFHAVHISYRQSYLTVSGQNINSLADAFSMLQNSEPSNPFTYFTDKTSSGYLAAANGIPRTVRSVLGGTEGSILDTYGGEYKWDKFNVYLLANRGKYRDFSIRYGVNMLDYNEDGDASGTYSSVIPYWTDGTTTIVGDKQNGAATTITGRGECVPLDVSNNFENEPTKAEVEAAGLAYINGNNTTFITQNIKVSFIRLQDMSEYADFDVLYQCELCDIVNVVFPNYNTSGEFKIVKTVWNVLKNRFDEMELGTLSLSLSEALGIDNGLSNGPSNNGISNIIETGTYGIWTYRKWSDGTSECWGSVDTTTSFAVWTNPIYYGTTYVARQNFPAGLFIEAPNEFVTMYAGSFDSWVGVDNGGKTTATQSGRYYPLRVGAGSTGTYTTHFYEIGRWE